MKTLPHQVHLRELVATAEPVVASLKTADVIELTQRFASYNDALPDAAKLGMSRLTAFEEHAVEAFELAGIDYLVKPVERGQIDRAVRRARKILWQRYRLDDGSPESAPASEPRTQPESASATRSPGRSSG